ncbi:MAG: hypothetical protein FWF11_04875 [Coriobacteriia bacterium]|nr:hypothetical protein [Coriobacteriia bacterium]
MGALCAPIALAGAANQQALQVVPSYVNPLTGKIEDTGNNPGLGQGMSENLVMKTPATLLVDSEGSIFITFRVGLVAESIDLAIQLLDSQGQVVETLPYSIVEDHPDDNTRDIRIKVPHKDPVLRISLISIPMGREVVCFATFAPEGEAVAIPLAEITEDDDSAISIFENSANDEITGIADEDRGQILSFLAIAAALLVVIGGAAGVIAVRKKKAAASAAAETPSVPSDDS